MTSMSQYLHVAHQYITHKDHADDDLACDAAKEEMHHITQAAVNRKFCRKTKKQKGHTNFKSKKRKRLKHSAQ